MARRSLVRWIVPGFVSFAGSLGALLGDGGAWPAALAGILAGAVAVPFAMRGTYRHEPVAPPPPVPAEADELPRPAAADDAELASLRARLQRSESMLHAHAELLQELARAAMPGLSRLEQAARGLAGSTPSEVDRRALPGALLGEIRRLRLLVSDLLAFGEIEVADVPAVPDRCEIRELLLSLARDVDAEECVDESVPALVFCDRALLSLAVAPLLAAATHEGRRPVLRASAEPRGHGLAALRVEVEPAPGLPEATLTAMSQQDALTLALPLLRQPGGSLGLAVALRAVTRIGGRLWTGEGSVELELVLPIAGERRGGRGEVPAETEFEPAGVSAV
ncbi:MAG: hypothetical protein KBD01_12380 [Acidobacteria bacterium]|nr:hypothetical protein [Acidobacteriota bacterium]